MRWLGRGIVMENERPKDVSPYVELSFDSSTGIGIAGMGPAALLDQWFIAFARATNLFLPETYSRLGVPAAEALPVTGRTPPASA